MRNPLPGRQRLSVMALPHLLRRSDLIVDPALLALALASAVTLFTSDPAKFLFQAALYVPLFVVALDRGYLVRRQVLLRRVWNGLSLLYLPVLFLDFAASHEIIGPIARLLYFLQLAKLFDRHADRDRYQLIAISFFQLLAASVLTTEATLLPGLLAFVVIGLVLLMAMASLKDGGETAEAPPVLRLSAVMTAGSAALAILIFFLIPRLSMGYFQRLRAESQIVSGFSDRVMLDRIGSIKKDPSVVMRVKRLDGDGPLDRPIYWTGITYSSYDGRQWQRAQRRSMVTRIGEDTHPIQRPRHDGPRVEFEFVVEPMDSEVVFVAGRPLTLRGRFFWLETDGSTIYSRYQRYYRMSYVESAELPERPASVPDAPGPRADIEQLKMPPGEERLAPFAQQITQGAATNYDACRKIEEYLRSNYAYTLDLPARDESLSVVDDFLFNQKLGHCEYFATSMALLCRSVGIPAVVVSGFLGGEFNSTGNFYVVRQLDAHAWVEAHFPGSGWIRFDPTPGAVETVAESPFSLIGMIRNYWDSYKLYWDRYVLTYNLWDQFYVIMEVSQAVQRMRGALQETLDRSRSYLQAPTIPRRAAAVAVAAICAAALLFFTLSSRKPLRLEGVAPVESRRIGRVARAYVRFLREAERRGYHKLEAETPLEFARRFPGDGRRAACRELAELYYAARYGDADPRLFEARLRTLSQQVLD
ncbi:MAG: DUF3488 and transglutaminase-like domain-containing protein [Acidobacteriota bacterium]